MSQFLQNLIGRHREAGVDKEVVAHVQPRPKARFETASEPKSLTQNNFTNRDTLIEQTENNTDAGTNLTRGLTNARSTAASDINRSALDAQVTTQQSNEKPVRPTDSSHQIKNLNERVESLTLQLGKNSPALETPKRATSKLINPIVENNIEISKMSEQPYPENLFVKGELNDRIQTILYRLNPQQSPAIENSDPVTRHDQTSVEIDKYPAYEPQQHMDVNAETISKSQQTNSIDKQNTIESINKQRPLNQTGLLKIPQWLSEMQTRLNDRVQQLQTQSNPEPVVNVTIGRVEVKAVQSDSVKQPKVRNKPSGVMSLDDYLKQRENRGQA